LPGFVAEARPPLGAPLSFIQRVFEVMASTPRHTYQILTKRAERLAELDRHLHWTKNVWMGVSVESQQYWDRVAYLRKTNAYTKVLSLEPLLGPLDLDDLSAVDWVIVRGESGPSARMMRESWVRSIRDACVRSDVAFHFKQWGGVNKKVTGRTLDGRTWDEMPGARKNRVRRLPLPELQAM
jgi:protein gp37